MHWPGGGLWALAFLTLFWRRKRCFSHSGQVASRNVEKTRGLGLSLRILIREINIYRTKYQPCAVSQLACNTLCISKRLPLDSTYAADKVTCLQCSEEVHSFPAAPAKKKQSFITRLHAKDPSGCSPSPLHPVTPSTPQLGSPAPPLRVHEKNYHYTIDSRRDS